MTREEAAELLCYGDWLNVISKHIGETDTERIAEAMSIVGKALRPVSREQVEKVWRGEWELVRRMAASIECKCPKCQRTVIFTGKPANFCEKCGSANTDEAVEMVMERMETLYEKT